MPAPDKHRIAALLDEIGALLELKGENPFKTRAYQNAARALQALEGDLAELVRTGEIRGVKGIGAKIAEAITTLTTTGSLPYYDELVASIPPGLILMVKIPGVGPRKALVLHEKLGVASVGDLEIACRENRLVALPGFGEKSQAKIFEGIAFVKRHAGSFLWPEAWRSVEPFVRALRAESGVSAVEIAGSLRRRKDVVNDADVLVESVRPEEVVRAFVNLSGVERVLAAGDTRGSVVLYSGLQVDLRVVRHGEFPFALHYFTGSKAHNIAMRGLAQRKGFKLNEYGLWKDDRSVPCETEADLFAALDLAYIPPELREDTGEIAAAAEGTLPRLVELEDLRGAFHAHSTWSDGKATIEEMARAAQALGWSYLGLSDHSKTAAYAGGMQEEAVARQHVEIDALNARLGGFRILKGIECDILADGTLDYPDEILARFDFVIGSVHSRFNLPAPEMTARITRAIANPYVSWIGHPTGRLLLSREAYAVDLPAVIDASARHGKFVELNAHPNRQDLDWQGCRYAKSRGLRVAINPDAHTLEGLQDVSHGIAAARRAWLTREDVLNALPLDEVMGALARGR